MKRAMMLGMLLAVAACSTAPEPAPAPAPTTASPPVAERPPTRPAPPPSVQACNAAQYQSLVGRPRSEIPVPVKPELQRVACTTCPVTMDFNPNRLNFFFDAQTGLIKEVRCG